MDGAVDKLITALPRLAAEPKRQTERAAPEAEVAQVQIVTAVITLLQRAEVANVSSQADVVGEEYVAAAADVETQLVLAQVVEQSATIDVAAQQPGLHRGAQDSWAGGRRPQRYVSGTGPTMPISYLSEM